MPASAEAGGTIALGVGADYAGATVNVWLQTPEPILLGSVLVDDAGSITVTLPAELEPGARTLAVSDATDAVIGWDAIEIVPGASTPAPTAAPTPTVTPTTSPTSTSGETPTASASPTATAGPGSTSTTPPAGGTHTPDALANTGFDGAATFGWIAGIGALLLGLGAYGLTRRRHQS